MNIRWEYKTVPVPAKGMLTAKVDWESLQRQWNELGGQQWELVNVFPLSEYHGRTRWVVGVFKRPA